MLPKIKEHLDEQVQSMLTKGAPEDDPDTEFMESELIKELNSLDGKFWSIMERKGSLDVKLLEEMRTKKTMEHQNDTTELMNQLQTVAETTDRKAKMDFESMMADNNLKHLDLDSFMTTTIMSTGDLPITDHLPTSPYRETNESLGILDLEGI